MPDASDKLRNFFEQLMRILPGYAGYADKEARRETDHQLRLHLAGQLGEAKSAFDALTRDLTKQPGGLELLDQTGSITKLLEKVIDRLKFADYGYAGFFDTAKVQEAQLEALYQFDLDLAQSVESLKARAAGLAPDAASLKAFYAELQHFDVKLNQRQDAISAK